MLVQIKRKETCQTNVQVPLQLILQLETVLIVEHGHYFGDPSVEAEYSVLMKSSK